MSATQDVIAVVSKGACAELLGEAGFRRSVPHFWRESGRINHAVNFQASAWGSSESGSFTINLGVSTRFLYEAFTGRAFPTNRGTALWPISARIGSLTADRRDLWWKVDVNADVPAIAEDVAKALRQYAFPFFDGLRTPEQLVAWVQASGARFGGNESQVPIIQAALAVEGGDPGGAQTLLRRAVGEHRGKPFESAIRSVATRLGVALDDA